MWSDGYVHLSWKSAIVIPIPKPGKDASLPLNYRPIALTGCMMKVFEKMVNTHLVWFLEKISHLSSVQCGFHRSRSNLDALLRLENIIWQAFACRQWVVSVFFITLRRYTTPTGVMTFYELSIRLDSEVTSLCSSGLFYRTVLLG